MIWNDFASSFEPKSLTELMAKVERAAKSLKFDSKPFSSGVLMLKLPLVVSYIFLLHLASGRKYSIASLGNGSKLDNNLERFLRKLGFNVITIDPKIFSYDDDDDDFTYGKERHDYLLKKNPELKKLEKNCMMLIDWVSPYDQEDPYDMEAIETINPIGIIAIYDTFTEVGQAGSLRFREWLDSIRDFIFYDDYEVASTKLTKSEKDICSCCQSLRCYAFPQISMIANRKTCPSGSGSLVLPFTLPDAVATSYKKKIENLI
ncbi:MAG: hypothetical protein EBQ92_00840 [Proteobacteria bacterium]|nr:hypothetical protein [Pseudomonadota bacterium]